MFWFNILEEVVGIDMFLGVIGVKIKNVNIGEVIEIFCVGVFVVIGYVFVIEFVKDVLEIYNGGYVKVEVGSICIFISGIFVVGDLIDYVYCQVVIFVGMGCMVVLDVEKFLVEQE